MRTISQQSFVYPSSMTNSDLLNRIMMANVLMNELIVNEQEEMNFIDMINNLHMNNNENDDNEEDKNDNHQDNDDDVQVLEVDSDDSENDSTVDEILTSRPFKARVKNQLLVETDATKSSATKCPTPLLELATPRAYSPTTTSPTLGAYATKRKVPTPAIPAMSASLVKEIGGKLYPDLRHNFVLALTSHARRLRHNAYQRAAFEAALRAIVVIR
jgi:hypothetical protein